MPIDPIKNTFTLLPANGNLLFHEGEVIILIMHAKRALTGF